MRFANALVAADLAVTFVLMGLTALVSWTLVAVLTVQGVIRRFRSRRVVAGDAATEADDLALWEAEAECPELRRLADQLGQVDR